MSLSLYLAHSLNIKRPTLLCITYNIFWDSFFQTILNLPSKYSSYTYLSTVMRFINFSSFHHEEESLLAFLQHLDGGLRHLRQAGLAFEAVLLDLSVALVLHVVPVENTCKSQISLTASLFNIMIINVWQVQIIVHLAYLYTSREMDYVITKCNVKTSSSNVKLKKTLKKLVY